MIRHLLLAAGCLLQTAAMAAAGTDSSAHKMHLKVLYVGYDPQRPMPNNVTLYSTGKGVVADVYQHRMADFKSFLEQRFDAVQVADVRDYTTALSQQVDVTILDAGPVNITPDFDRPTMLLHQLAPNVGMPLHLKFDWYCQCLENDALNIRTGHEIFRTPNAVHLTMETRPTPGSFFNGFEGLTTPKTMPMWNVIKRSANANNYVIGMVAHGEGFNDSPDAEVISGGVCLKNAEAVALGRQANYFMWGFSASPSYMTDEAKDVFVNAVVYIKKFDHQHAQMEKVQTVTRTGIDEIVYRTDKSLYDKTIISRREGNARLLKFQDSLRAEKAAGKDIGRGGEAMLHMPITNAVQSFEDYIKGFIGDELFAKYGTDTKRIHQYYHDNYEYFYPDGAYSLQLDTDAQSLGISNRKVDILEKCVTLLESNKDTALAMRVLTRYTWKNFKTAPEWRQWLTENKAHFFYTEAGGFKFMVNTMNAAPAATSNATGAEAAAPSRTDPVLVKAQLRDGAAGKKQVVINAAILKGWHIYALVPEASPFIVTEQKLEIPKGTAVDAEWKPSAGVPFEDGMFIYEDQATFTADVDAAKLKKGEVIRCGLYYQVCDNKKCFQPQTKWVEVTVE